MPKIKRNVLDGLPFTTIPDYFLSQIMTTLSHSELRVMLYIYLHTLGYGKRADAISYDQFLNGIIAADGRRIDYGAGVKRRALVTALHGLEHTHKLISRSHRGFHSVATIQLEINQSAIEETSSNQQAQSLPLGDIAKVQVLHSPKESEFNHENHENRAAEVSKSVITVETANPQELEALKVITDNIPGIAVREAQKLVALAFSPARHRDLSYIRRLVDYVTTCPHIRTPAAVLTTLIRADEERTPSSENTSKVYPKKAKRFSFGPPDFSKYQHFADHLVNDIPLLDSPPSTGQPEISGIELWSQIQEDLAGRYRVATSELERLKGSVLRVQAEQVSVVMASVWQQRELGLTARSAVGMALRQRLGPGFSLEFVIDLPQDVGTMV